MMKVPNGLLSSVLHSSNFSFSRRLSTVDGTQVGSVESALVCRSLFDLYIGDDPFDKDAKKAIGLNIASLLHSQ